jgi:hypothetical protein
MKVKPVLDDRGLEGCPRFVAGMVRRCMGAEFFGRCSGGTLISSPPAKRKLLPDETLGGVAGDSGS